MKTHRFAFNAVATVALVFGFAYATQAQIGDGSKPERRFVIPHVLETSGRTSGASTFDTSIMATYAGGLAGTSGSGAAIILYLYDAMKKTGGLVI